MLNKVL